MSELAAKQCVPCKGGVPPLAGEPLDELLAQLGPNGWQVVSGHHLEKSLHVSPISCGARLRRTGSARVAEEQGHHPDIYLGWGKVTVTSGRTRSKASPRATSSSPPRPTRRSEARGVSTGSENNEKAPDLARDPGPWGSMRTALG